MTVRQLVGLKGFFSPRATDRGAAETSGTNLTETKNETNVRRYVLARDCRGNATSVSDAHRAPVKGRTGAGTGIGNGRWAGGRRGAGGKGPWRSVVPTGWPGVERAEL